MSLLDTIRVAVKIANDVTRSLQPTVTYKRYVGQTGDGTRTYANPVPLHAIVEFKSQRVRTQEGVDAVTRAVITLLDVDEVIAATGGSGIGNEDVFILPDGDSGPTLDLGGFVDAGRGFPVATEVMQG